MAPPQHFLTNKQRVILIVISVILMGIGLFIDLMRHLERTPAVPATPATATSQSTTGISSDLPHGTVHVKGIDIPVELAMDETSQKEGLSDRDSLPADRGMLFLMGTSQNQMFWMHGMRFPLDMVFINGTTVVRVSANVPVPKFGEFPAIRSSDGKADKVLEINAGKAAEWGITEGTEVVIDE